MGTASIERVRAATIRHRLQTPIDFGPWTMTHREFALVRLDADNGTAGYAYGLTRDGPVASIVDRSVAPCYLGRAVGGQETLFASAMATNFSILSNGVGLRALSLVDLAAWDLAAKTEGLSIRAYLGGDLRPLPAIAIVGYPPSMSTDEALAQIEALWARGWRRFKLPTAGRPNQTVERMSAARASFPEAWLALDNNWRARTADEALATAKRLDHLDLGWIEDVLPPGHVPEHAELRRAISTPVAIGDEQGGAYYPDAILEAGAADIVRMDATTNGGLTGIRSLVSRVQASGARLSPHMFPHVHSRIALGLGLDVPIEWGVPGTGVHSMDDSLEQPVVAEGLMEPLADEPGFGTLVDREWIGSQEVHDPDNVLSY